MSAAAERCPACGAELVAWRAFPSAEPSLGPRHLSLARCDRCGTAVTAGTPVATGHTAGAYGGGRPRGTRLATPLLTRFDRQRLTMLPPAPARLIDAGAGRGRFVAAARAAGYDARGIEPSLRDVRPDLDLLPFTIEGAPLEPGCADIVTLWHVLEHLPDGSAALSRIRDWLVPGGHLLLGVPNLDSWQARLGGERWYHLDLPRHRVHYTEAGVRALLRTNGFEVIAVRHRLLEHNPYGMWQSWVSQGTHRISYLYNLLKRNAPLVSSDLLVTLAAVPLIPSAAALEWIAAGRRRGGTIAVLARRV